jgi:hypothetical protein
MKELKVSDIAKKIDVPVKHWIGNCYGIAMAIIARKVVKGKARYGHYVGPIHPNSHFANVRHLGWCRHGWIELPNKQICDPTRWVFENTDPYIYIGENDFYDVGGNKFRQDNLRLPPAFDSKSKRQVTLKVSSSTDNLVRNLLNDDRVNGAYSQDQLFWLANCPPQMFKSSAKEIYQALKEEGCIALIPFDNWTLIME